MASGFPIFTDNIPGVGPMRIRYPVMPIHEHGNVLYKDISALTDMTLKKHKYLNLYKDLKRLDNDTVEEVSESHRYRKKIFIYNKHLSISMTKTN